LAFANAVSGLQNNLAIAYSKRDVSQNVTVVNELMGEFEALIGTIATTEKAGESWKLKMEALCFYMTMVQRENSFSLPNEKKTLETEFLNMAKNINKFDSSAHIPETSVYSAQFTLNFQVKNQMPEIPPKIKNGVLQQFEDAAQFDGFAKSAVGLGLSLNADKPIKDNSGHRR
jgi:K+-sensing histidine kinase KdpD